jgi:hypothetical protein
MKSFVIAAAAAVALLAAAACSPASIAPPSVDAGPDAAPDAPSTTFEGACKEYAYTRCTQIQSCSPTATLSAFGTVDVCEQYYRTTCELTGALPSSSSTIAHVNACTAEIPGWKCSDIIYGENVPPDCQTLPGALASGSPCTVSAQCQSAWCGHALGSACGVCAPTPKAGTPCTISIQCGSGLTCVQSTGTCAVHAPLGGQCSGTQPCDDGLACVSGVCAAGASPSGATCSPLGAGCDFYAGLSCNAMSNTCQTLQLVPGGEACGQVGNQLQDCVTGACVRGACAQSGALGAACDLTSPEPCISFAQCVVTTDAGTMGTCQLPASASCN